MNEILVLTNDANEARLINFANHFAYQNGGRLTVAYNYSMHLQPVLASTANSSMHPASIDEIYLRDINSAPELKDLNTFDASRFRETELATYIWKKGFSLVIGQLGSTNLDMQLLLNQLHCPLLLVPTRSPAIKLHRIAYLTDLRYCQQHILTYLAKFKQNSLLIAHICQQGLPDLILSYGEELFADTVRYHKTFPELFFSHVKDKDLAKIADTLIYTMHADILVCQNRQYHFQKLLGDSLPELLPDHVSVPVLIFPC